MKYLRIRELSIHIVADAGGGAAAARLPVQLEHVSTVARLGVGPGSGPLFQVQLRISFLDPVGSLVSTLWVGCCCWLVVTLFLNL